MNFRYFLKHAGKKVRCRTIYLQGDSAYAITISRWLKIGLDASDRVAGLLYRSSYIGT